MAMRPWQRKTMEAFLPKLSELWSTHALRVRYAREEKAFHGNDDFGDPNPAEYQALRDMAYAKKKQKDC